MTTNATTFHPFSLYRYAYPVNWGIKIKIFLTFGFIFLAALLAFYALQTSAEVSEISVIRSYERRIGELSKENQELEFNLIRLMAADIIAPKVGDLNMERSDKVSYIKILDNKVVVSNFDSNQ